MPDESHQLPNFDAMPDQSQHHPGLIEGAYKPITDIPSTYMQMVKGAEEQMGRGVEQLGTGQPWEMAKGAGNLALGGLGYVGAPISAPLHTIIGVPIGEVTRTPWLGNAAEIAASLMLPVPKGIPRTAAAMPEEAPFGVTLSAGERANDLAMRQAEQNALRGRPAEANSQLQAWVDQRQAQLRPRLASVKTSIRSVRRLPRIHNRLELWFRVRCSVRRLQPKQPQMRLPAGQGLSWRDRRECLHRHGQRHQE